MATALEVATQVRSGERSAREVIDEHLDRIAEGNGSIHAFLEVTADAARAAATAVDEQVAAGQDPGPLAGVPVALKDNLCTRGVPTTCGSKILDGWRPPYDATVVRRLRAAGGIDVGKTNLDEFAMGSSTENSAFGPTRNPLDLDCVPGGSSGGSAAAVAAEMAPLALGTDTGGSIRQPAALCGLVGVKPTYGLVSRYGLIAFASSLDQVGPLTADVADAAAFLDVIAGPDERDSTSVAQAQPPVADTLDRGVGGLRIGVLDEITSVATPDVRARVQAAADALAAAGAEVGEVSVPACRQALTSYYLVAPAEASSNLARFDGVRYGLRVDGADTAEMMINTRTAGFGPEVKARIMLGTYALSAGYYDAYYGRAQRLRVLLQQEFAVAYERFDVLLGATSPTTAFRFGDRADDPMAMYASDLCTLPSSLAGHPAVTVPYGVGDDGMPVGVQVLGPALSDPLVFRVAAAVEATR